MPLGLAQALPAPAAGVDPETLEQVRRNRLLRFSYSSAAVNEAASPRPPPQRAASSAAPPQQQQPRREPSSKASLSRRARAASAPVLAAPGSPTAALPRAPPTPPPRSASADAPAGEWVSFAVPGNGVVYIHLDCDVTPAVVDSWAAGEKEWPPMHTLEISSVARRAQGISDDMPGPSAGAELRGAAQEALKAWGEERKRAAVEAAERNRQRAGAAGGAAQAQGGASPADAAEAAERESSQAALVRDRACRPAFVRTKPSISPSSFVAIVTTESTNARTRFETLNIISLTPSHHNPSDQEAQRAHRGRRCRAAAWGEALPGGGG